LKHNVFQSRIVDLKLVQLFYHTGSGVSKGPRFWTQALLFG
jgi:hypothetical protein